MRQDDAGPTWLMTKKATPAAVIGCIYSFLAVLVLLDGLSNEFTSLDLVILGLGLVLAIWALTSYVALRRHPSWQTSS